MLAGRDGHTLRPQFNSKARGRTRPCASAQRCDFVRDDWHRKRLAKGAWQRADLIAGKEPQRKSKLRKAISCTVLQQTKRGLCAVEQARRLSGRFYSARRGAWSVRARAMLAVLSSFGQQLTSSSKFSREERR